jgi:hypothetical protein
MIKQQERPTSGTVVSRAVRRDGAQGKGGHEAEKGEKEGGGGKGSEGEAAELLQDWISLVRSVRSNVTSDISRMRALLASLPSRPTPIPPSPSPRARLQQQQQQQQQPHPTNTPSTKEAAAPDCDVEGVRQESGTWAEELAYSKPAFEPAKWAGPSAAHVQSVYGVELPKSSTRGGGGGGGGGGAGGKRGGGGAAGRRSAPITGGTRTAVALAPTRAKQSDGRVQRNSANFDTRPVMRKVESVLEEAKSARTGITRAAAGSGVRADASTATPGKASGRATRASRGEDHSEIHQDIKVNLVHMTTAIYL